MSDPGPRSDAGSAWLPLGPSGADGDSAPSTVSHPTELEVTHDTRYRYGAAVSSAMHLAYLRPIDDADQRLLAHALRIDPPPDESSIEPDVFGNHSCRFAHVGAHRVLRVTARTRVCLRARFAGLQPDAGPAWESLAARLRYVGRAAFVPAVEFVQPSPYVPRLEALRRYALESFAPGRAAATGAIDLMRRVHADFRYDDEATEIETPLAEAFEGRHGVCQDFAHVMAGALRMLGLPARYVSGYLLTHAPDGGPAMLGADASHAWVQAWVPGTPGVDADGWLDLDPTNDVVPGSGHVRLATGRDYGDVTPLRGVIRGGGGEHTLTVAVRTRRIEPGARAGPGVA
jgi:transglutaminase-like putative cysteine protease